MRDFAGGDAVIIGARLADRMHFVPGGKITLIAPRGNVTPFGMTPRVKSYTVAGTFRIGMSEYDPPSSSCRWTRRSFFSTPATASAGSK